MFVVRWWTYSLLLAPLAACTGDPDPCALSAPGTVCRIAGVGESAFNGDGHDALETALYLPSQMRRGPDDLLYLMDFNNMRLRRIDEDGTVSTVAGNGIHLGAIEGDLAVDSSLENPIDFDFLPDGRIVLVSSHDPRIWMIDFDNTMQVVAGGLPGEIGNEGDGGPAKYARFVDLAGIAVAPDGAIYISDGLANRVRVIRDGIINTVAGTGVPGLQGDGGVATRAQLKSPSALALDVTGNLYISDTLNCSVRKITADGTINTVVGSGYKGFAGDGGPAPLALLAHPEGLAVAPDGTMYIGDRFNNRVRRVDVNGTITTIAGTGESGLAGDGGPALDATFGHLGRVQLDTDGGLLVADQTNGAIRKILAPR
jgi:hypothetical protein